MLICPRCQQAYLLKAKIKKINKVIFLCEECEAMWLENQDINLLNFVDFGTYLVSHRLQPLWDEIEVIPSKFKTISVRRLD